MQCDREMGKVMYTLYQHLFTTVELQWLGYIWNHEKMFQTVAIRANKCLSWRQVKRLNRAIFTIFFYMKVCCLFSVKSPHGGDSNE